MCASFNLDRTTCPLSAFDSQIVQWTELGLKTRVITLTDRHFPDILDTSDAWFIDFFAGTGNTAYIWTYFN